MNRPASREQLIPHSRVYIGKAEQAAVLTALRKGDISTGPAIAGLKRELCQVLGVRYGVPTACGTAALHLALVALGVGPSDEVIIPSYVCMALVSAIRNVGARPVLADVEAQTYNISAESVRKVLSSRTRAIIVPHLFGLPCDLDALLAYGVPLIEDCAHSLGNRYKKRKVGSVGTLSICSFYATKIIGAAAGGFLGGKDPCLIGLAEDLSYYGGKTGGVHRFNYRISNLDAAIVCCQLRRLRFFVRRRKAIARLYTASFRELPLVLPASLPRREHIFYRYVVKVDGSAETFRQRMASRAVRCGHGVLEPLHRALGLNGRMFPNTEDAFAHSVSIPIYPAMSKREVGRVIRAVRETMDELST